ncbi:MAG: hypothetical protein JJ894_05550 [Dinoroseobacter sp.]|nr:hypothetical protein [Dinoroseobacter sp.]
MPEPKIIRANPHGRLVRPHWLDPMVDENTRTPGEHHEAIGTVVTSFNSVELMFKYLVGMAAGLDTAAFGVFAHVGNVTLSDAARYLASKEGCDSWWADELQFSALAFDLARRNRNFIVHNSTFRAVCFEGDDFTLMTRRSARGTERIQHWRFPLAALRGSAESNVDLEEYFSVVCGPIRKANRYAEGNVKLPVRPDLPRELSKVFPEEDLIREP